MNINTKKKSKNFCTAISSILFCVVMSFGLGSQVDKKDRGLLDEVHNVSPNITETLSRVTGTKSGVLNANGKFYADYATLDEAKAKAKELAIQIAAEGDVLLKNANGALPLRSEEKNITLLGLRTVDLVRSGFGSGAGGGSSPTEAATLLSSMTDAGFAVNPKPLTLYIAQRALMTDGFQLEISIDKYLSSIIATYAGYNDAAILTFSRTGQENLDCATNRVAGHADENEHYLQLDDNERDLIRHAKKYFNKIIVLVNSSNIMQIPDLAEEKTATNLGVDAILWVGSVGANGVSAIGQILKGSICPSGHTVDLWEKDFTKAPTWTNFGTQTQNKDANGNRLDPFLYNQQGKALNYANVEYREGIYSGYRYYETLYADAIGAAAKAAAYENVLYPFGYGLAYTSFEWKLDNIAKTAKITAANQSITMRAWVKNTGSVAGKDVVQIFYRAPYTKGGIEKSATNLIGFAKTKLLQPGESDVVTVTFAAQEMASFDELDANSNGFKGYELEAGVYLISLNRNSHKVVDSVTRTIDTTIKCGTDLVSGQKIEPIFTGEFSIVNDSLKSGLISRATGLKQPKPSSKADRTLTDAKLAWFDAQDTYYSYQDKATDPWYVSALPSGWNQAPSTTTTPDNIKISFAEIAGVPYTEPTKNAAGIVTLATDSDSQKWEAFMNQFTWAELCSLPATPNSGIARAGISSYSDPDGPISAGGVQFPSNPIVAATFNQKLALDLGTMVGNLLLLNGSSGWRGSGADIHRSPFSGRNFEYFSEDGVMSGLIGLNVSLGVTNKGIIAHFKHFFGNDQETYRADYGGVATWETEQTLREITAKPFEYIVKYGNVLGLMTSFNRIGGIVNSNNYAVHEKLLNQEWGFKGSTETDAWAKDYVPANLMVRGGDDQLLSRDSSYPKNALERGVWDETAKCVRVAANASEYAAGTASMLSPTHYFAVRKCAQRLLQSSANSLVNKNGYKNGLELKVTLERGVYNSVRVALPSNSDISITLPATTVWPTGLTYNNGMITGIPTTEGETTIDGVTLIIDGWIKNITAKIVVKVISSLKYNNQVIIPDAKAEISINQAYSGLFNTTTLAYGNIVPITNSSNRIIVNCYASKIDGTKKHRDEDKSAADIITMSINDSDLTQSILYGYSYTGNLPPGLTFTEINDMKMGYAKRVSYEVPIGYKLSGTPTAPGTYTFTITLKVPHTSKGTNPWIQASATSTLLYSQQFTIVVK